jgi:hypothetical protein
MNKKRLQKLAGLIKEENSIKIDVPEDTDVKDFAISVAQYLINEYGSHLVKRFMDTLQSELKKDTRETDPNMMKALYKDLNEGEDHEVSMVISSLKSIIKSSAELMKKLGNEERNIPGWIQDHITNAENYIDQAAQGFHEISGGLSEMVLKEADKRNYGQIPFPTWYDIYYMHIKDMYDIIPKNGIEIIEKQAKKGLTIISDSDSMSFLKSLEELIKPYFIKKSDEGRVKEKYKEIQNDLEVLSFVKKYIYYPEENYDNLVVIKNLKRMIELINLDEFTDKNLKTVKNFLEALEETIQELKTK